VRHRIASLSELPEGCGWLVEVAGREVALFRRGDRVTALDAICPHQGGCLAFGEVRGGIVYCPVHAWPFDIATGCCVEDGLERARVKTFPVHLQGDDVLVEL
jgi:nitrite reductase (NADH) small subunit